MPRRTGITISTTPKTPYELGPKLVDAEGDSVTQDEANAVRTFPVGTGNTNLTKVETATLESLIELKRIRRANELILGQDVELEDAE